MNGSGGFASVKPVHCSSVILVTVTDRETGEDPDNSVPGSFRKALKTVNLEGWHVWKLFLCLTGTFCGYSEGRCIWSIYPAKS